MIFICFVFFSSLLGQVASKVTMLRNAIGQDEIAAKKLRTYFAYNRVPRQLAYQIIVYCKATNNKHTNMVAWSDVPVLDKLPYGMRVHLASIAFMPVVTAHPFFLHYRSAHHHILVELCVTAISENSFYKADEIFHCGLDCNAMFFIHFGMLTYDHEIAECCRDDISDGEWLCEGSLWVVWGNRGNLTVLDGSCGIVSIDRDAFATINLSEPPTRLLCKSYAQRWCSAVHKHCNEKGWPELTDFWHIPDPMAHLSKQAETEESQQSHRSITMSDQLLCA